MPDDIKEQTPADDPKYPTKLTFKKPLEIDGKTLTELNLNPESLAKVEYSKLKQSFRSKFGRSDNNQSIVMDERFQNMLIAKLNEITPEGFVAGLSVEDEEAAHMIITGFFSIAGMGRMGS
jgi:hypothetical protein